MGKREGIKKHDIRYEANDIYYEAKSCKFKILEKSIKWIIYQYPDCPWGSSINQV